MEKFQNKYRIASTRLPKWDYGWDATYYVTICTHNREHFFGEIETFETLDKCFVNLNLSDIGEIAQKCWREIPNHFPFVRLGNYIVMPNHVHGMIIIVKRNYSPNGDPENDIPNPPSNGVTNEIQMGPSNVQTLHATSLQSFSMEKPRSFSTEKSMPTGKNARMSSISPHAGTLGSIVRSYKSAVSKNAHEIKPGFAWQPNYYEQIIHDSEAYVIKSKYITDNPINWAHDKQNRP
jgi:putative transposase